MVLVCGRTTTEYNYLAYFLVRLAQLKTTNRPGSLRRVIIIVYLEKIKIVLVVVDVQDLAKQVPVAEVMIQVQHPLLEAKVLVQPPFHRSVGERHRQMSILLVIQYQATAVVPVVFLAFSSNPHLQQVPYGHRSPTLHSSCYETTYQNSVYNRTAVDLFDT